jgi:uncharacterized membrane protein
MARTRVLLAGESWVSAAVHHKGWDHFGSVTFHLGAEPLVAALADSPFDLHYMPAHEAAARFPLTLEGLQEYGAVILSDLGSNTLLLHPDVWLTGKPVANRLKLLREYVRAGAGLMMIGGYYSFQGINGGARYRGTAVEEVLPVDCLPYDDRIEVPEGFRAKIVGSKDHPILEGLDGEWPLLLGVNEVVLKARSDVQLLARLPETEGSHPLLATGTYGSGRTLAWTSDIGPHWLPQTFAQWEGYPRLWRQALAWLTRQT